MNRIIYLAFAICGLASSLELQAATNNYALSYRDDPATTVVVGWGGDNGTVYYGTTDEGTNYANYPMNHTVDRVGNAHSHNRYFARLTGLTPNTMYYFVIHDANGVTSSRYKFKTLSDDPNVPVSFVNGGDTRDGLKIFGFYTEDCPSGDCLEMRRAGNDLVALIRPDFVAFNGDYVQNQINSDTEAEWNTWLNDWQRTISTDGRMYPILHSRGNHEDATDTYELFDIPQEEYYALDIHGGLLRYYSLNTEIDACSGTSQLNWLTNDLQTHSTGGVSDPVWKMAQYHSPTYAIGKDGALETDQMSCWVPLFEQYDVRLVSESDSHSSKWTWPCKRNSAGDDFEQDDDGVVYIGEGQWGAPHRDIFYTGSSAKPYVRDAETFDNFFFVTVRQDSITVQSVKFQNISSVTASTDDNLGHGLPAGVTLWSPSNGDMVVIKKVYANVADIDVKVDAIFPNPASSEVNIKFKESTNGTLELYNSLGKLCKSESVNGINHTLDIEDACSGVNYIYIKSEDGTVESYKIVKE